MGTRSLTHIKNEDGETLVTIYRQCDGYPTGMGADIKATLGDKTLVNGYSDPETQTNGMGCAAAMLIAAIKDGCGNVYIIKPDSADCWEEYVYTLSQAAGMKIALKLESGKKTLFDGLLSDFNPEAVEAAEAAAIEA